MSKTHATDPADTHAPNGKAPKAGLLHLEPVEPDGSGPTNVDHLCLTYSYTAVRPTSIPGCEGVGMFATRRVPKGSIVHKYLPESNTFDISRNQWDAILAASANPDSTGKDFRDFAISIKTYGYYDFHRDVVCYVVSNTRYVNHGSHPSSSQDQSDTTFGGGVTGVANAYGFHTSIALRDIEAGEEILEDYRVFEHEDFKGTSELSYACPWLQAISYQDVQEIHLQGDQAVSLLGGEKGTRDEPETLVLLDAHVKTLLRSHLDDNDPNSVALLNLLRRHGVRDERTGSLSLQIPKGPGSDQLQ